MSSNTSSNTSSNNTSSNNTSSNNTSSKTGKITTCAPRHYLTEVDRRITKAQYTKRAKQATTLDELLAIPVAKREGDYQKTFYYHQGRLSGGSVIKFDKQVIDFLVKPESSSYFRTLPTVIVITPDNIMYSHHDSAATWIDLKKTKGQSLNMAGYYICNPVCVTYGDGKFYELVAVDKDFTEFSLRNYMNKNNPHISKFQRDFFTPITMNVQEMVLTQTIENGYAFRMTHQAGDLGFEYRPNKFIAPVSYLTWEDAEAERDGRNVLIVDHYAARNLASDLFNLHNLGKITSDDEITHYVSTDGFTCRNGRMHNDTVRTFAQVGIYGWSIETAPRSFGETYQAPSYQPAIAAWESDALLSMFVLRDHWDYLRSFAEGGITGHHTKLEKIIKSSTGIDACAGGVNYAVCTLNEPYIESTKQATKNFLTELGVTF